MENFRKVMSHVTLLAFPKQGQEHSDVIHTHWHCGSIAHIILHIQRYPTILYVYQLLIDISTRCD